MSKWIEVGGETDIAPGSKKCVNADGIPVVVCNVQGKLTAFENYCPHAGLPLGEGDMSGTVITCPFHGYSFSIESGKNVDFADDIPLSMMPVKCEGGKVMVEVKSQ